MPQPKSAINMSRPMALYALTLGLLMLLALLVSNVPPLSLSHHFDIPFRKALCLTLLVLGSVSGMGTVLLHQARGEQPWRVPQSLVSRLYVAFVTFTILGILTLR